MEKTVGSHSTDGEGQDSDSAQGLAPVKMDMEARNREFRAMSPEAKRVALAEDVIRHLNTKALIASSGSYVHIIDAPLGSAELHTYIGNPNCRVCAIGSLLMSHVGHVDNFQVTTTRPRISQPYVTVEGSAAEKHLRGVFPVGQLRLMELYFEGWDVQEKFSDKQERSAREWFDAAGDDDARLRQIMANVIENGGTFKPAPSPVTGGEK